MAEVEVVKAVRAKGSVAVDSACHLVDIGVCTRCILRFLNVRNHVYTSCPPSPSELAKQLSLSANPEEKECPISEQGNASLELEKNGLQKTSSIAESAQKVTGCALDEALQVNVQGELLAADFNSNGHGCKIDAFSGMEKVKPTASSSAPCIACLGVLHLLEEEGASLEDKGSTRTRAGAKQKILKAMQESGHSFSSFCLEVTIPALLLLRERSLWNYLHGKYAAKGLFQETQADSTVTLKEALKWSLIAPLEAMAGVRFSSTSDFRVSLLYTHVDSAAEVDTVATVGSSVGSKRRRQGGRRGGRGGDSGPGKAWLRDGGAGTEVTGPASVDEARLAAENGEAAAAVQRALATMSPEDLAECYPCPPQSPASECTLTVMCWRQPVYVGGRYLKLSRAVSQSRWMVEDERMGEGSVQELVGDPVVAASRADSYKFHAAGREDIDVRMLGNGRPFLLELLNARQIPEQQALSEAEKLINGREEGWVEIRGLRVVGSEAAALMREGEADKQKEYMAVIWLSRPATPSDLALLNATRDLTIHQRTPVRVLHRRSALLRDRTIHSLRATSVPGNPNFLILHMCTQAGTYVKEFVHGDMGRTTPNIGTLLDCEADILQLDVAEIKMDFSC